MIKKITKYWTKNVGFLERILLLIIVTRCIFNEDNTIWLLGELISLVTIAITPSSNHLISEE